MGRHYSSIAQAAELSAAIDSSTNLAVISSVTGWPLSTPFTAVIDAGHAGEEIVTVTNVAGTTLTVTRGEDGTAAVAHDTGAEVRHMLTARDLAEPQAHMEAGAGVHGLIPGSEVVGTDDEQVVKNKTLRGTENTFEGIPQSAIDGLIAALTAIGTDAAADLASAVSTLNSAIGGRALSSHQHAAGDITSGVIDIARIPDVPIAKVTGTIDADKIDGRTIFVQATTPTTAVDGDIWFQVV